MKNTNMTTTITYVPAEAHPIVVFPPRTPAWKAPSASAWGQRAKPVSTKGRGRPKSR